MLRILSPLLLLLAVGCNPFYYREEYAGGQLKKEGSLSLTRNQKGIWKYYYQTGQLKAHGSYEDDIQVGDWTYYYKNGNKEMAGRFEGKRRQGLWEFWYGDGVPKARGWFHQGRETGFWEYWSREGKKLEEGDFLGGNLALRWTYFEPSGEVKSSGHFHEGVRVGEWTLAGGGRRVYPLPAGVDLVQERWPDGTLKRTGFLHRGQKVGRWVTFHRNGQRRLTADFLQGQARGPAMLFDADGKPLATGTVEERRLRDDWVVWINGELQPMGQDDIKPAGVHPGEWSYAGLADEISMEDVARTWLSEVSSVTPEVVSVPEANASPEMGAVQRLPAKAQPWTVSEEEKIEYYTKVYEEGARYDQVNIPGSRDYIPVSEKERRDDSRSEALIGKPLPWTQFQAADGSLVDLKQHHGQEKVILVVLRGFAGQVCVYCATQTKAYARSRAFQKLAALDTKVYVVYPGPEGGMDAFFEAYSSLYGEEDSRPPYRMLYDPDLALVDSWGLRSDLAIPTTVILDERGIIRWAYVGVSIEDRPSAEELILQVESLNRG